MKQYGDIIGILRTSDPDRMPFQRLLIPVHIGVAAKTKPTTGFYRSMAKCYPPLPKIIAAVLDGHESTRPVGKIKGVQLYAMPVQYDLVPKDSDQELLPRYSNVRRDKDLPGWMFQWNRKLVVQAIMDILVKMGSAGVLATPELPFGFTTHPQLHEYTLKRPQSQGQRQSASVSGGSQCSQPLQAVAPLPSAPPLSSAQRLSYELGLEGSGSYVMPAPLILPLVQPWQSDTSSPSGAHSFPSIFSPSPR